MSNQITTAFVQQYSNNVQMLSQQKGSLLRSAVDVETVVGKNAFFDQVGSALAVKRTTRHADTPQMDTPHARRRVSLVDYEYADLIDNQDKIRTLIDPTSSYASAAAFALGRAQDDEIITALSGTAFTGETGSTSSDFNSVKALANGEVNSFLGFNFIVSNRLAIASSKRLCLVWAMDGCKMAIGQDLMTRIDERSDKGYAHQVYVCQSIGATRMEEDKVVTIQSHEA